MIQSLPITSPSGPVDRSGDNHQPTVSWKRWAVRILPVVPIIGFAALAYGAVSAGYSFTGAVLGALGVFSADWAIVVYLPNNFTSAPATFFRNIVNPGKTPGRSDITSNIVYSQGFEIVDVPGDGNCLFSAALVPCVEYTQCSGQNAHTLRQHVYKEAIQWLQEFDNNRSSFDESCPDPVQEDLYCYLTGDSDHSGLIGIDAIKGDGVWMYTVIAPLVARVLKKPVILVNDTGTIMSGVNASGFYFPITDTQLKNFDLNAFGDFILLEMIDDNHFRGCKRRTVTPEDQDGHGEIPANVRPFK